MFEITCWKTTVNVDRNVISVLLVLPSGDLMLSTDFVANFCIWNNKIVKNTYLSMRLLCTVHTNARPFDGDGRDPPGTQGPLWQGNIALPQTQRPLIGECLAEPKSSPPLTKGTWKQCPDSSCQGRSPSQRIRFLLLLTGSSGNDSTGSVGWKEKDVLSLSPSWAQRSAKD